MRTLPTPRLRRGRPRAGQALSSHLCRREALVLVVVAGAVGLLYSDGVHSVPPFLWAGSRGVLPPAGPFIFQHHTQAPEALSVEPEELVQVGD